MSLDEKIDLSAARRWRRGFLVWGSLATVVALAVGWTTLWFAASHVAQSRLDDWFAQEAELGRSWSCPSRSVEGFPSKLSIVCDAPTFSGPLEGVDVQARLTRLAAGTLLSRPGHIDVDFGGPLILEARDQGVKLALAFARLRLDVQLSLEKLQRVALLGEDLQIHWNGPNAAINGAARSVELAAQPVDAAEQTYDIAVKSAGLVFPALDEFTNSSDPAALLIDARLSGAAPLATRSWTERLERWRIARGQLWIGRLIFVKGALELTASGDGGLDEAHRLEGRAEVGEKGADSTLLRLGAPPAAIGVANMLGGLLRGGPDAGRPAVRLPLSAKDGKVAVGPLRNVFSLKPLY